MPGEVIEFYDHEGGLHDLRRDPGERYDVSDSHPEIDEKLKQIANEAREDLGHDLYEMPGKNRREPGRVSIELD